MVESRAIDIMRQFGGFLVTELAKLDGFNWVVEDAGPSDAAWTVNLTREGGVKIFVRPDGNRVRFIGSYPDHTVYPSPEGVEITVSRDKDPGKIAGDISRRFLPKYLAELQRVAEGNALDAEQLKAREAAFASLSDMVSLDRGRKEPKLSDTRWVADYRRRRAEGPDLRAEITCDVWGSRYQVDIAELTIDEVSQILWVLKGGRNADV